MALLTCKWASDPVKLLFVGTSPGLGGTETHFVTLARALALAGDDVVAVVKPGSAMERWLAGGPVRVSRGAFRNSLDPRGALAVARAIRRERPDWLIGAISKEYWPLALLAAASGVPLALFKHMDFEMRPLTRRFIPRLARRFILVSESMRRSFLARGLPPEHLSVLPNPIDTEYFRPDAELRTRTRAELGLGPEDVAVGYLGRLSPEKGIYALADALDAAMERAPALRAFWIGAGPDRDALAARLAASPSAARQRVLPFMADVRPAYAALDILALPSLIPESFGRVAAEAEACGVAVLASRTGGIPEAVGEGDTGLLLPPGEVRAWADALVELALDEPRRRRFAAAGPGFVRERFAAEAVAQRFRALLLERPQSGA